MTGEFEAIESMFRTGHTQISKRERKGGGKARVSKSKMADEFYKPTEAENAKMLLVKNAIKLLSGAIAAAAENHDTFAEMVFWLSNDERWQWVGLLRPIGEFYDRLNRTTVDPATGLNQVKEAKTVPSIMAQITPQALEAAAAEGEHEIISELRDRIAQIQRKSHRAWPEFPSELIARCKTLIQEGNRMAALPLMPTESKPLRSYTSVTEWQRSLLEDENQQSRDDIR
jgi:hypothetical protein